MALLEIKDLVAGFDTPRGFMRAVDGVSLSIDVGQTVGLVGESGCGKSATAFSILRLLPFPAGKILSGSIRFNGIELTTLNEKALCGIRGKDISIIFQEPMSALNPVMRIGDQIAEGLILHEKVSKQAALARAIELLTRVGIPDAAHRARAYPHELSGGQRQRVVIAMALVCKPKLIIADEPTTALDVTLQVQIINLLAELRKEVGAAILFITHDLGLVQKLCDETYVMYAGQIVESGPTQEVFAQHKHPYTTALLSSRITDKLAPKTPLPSIEGRLPTYWEYPTGCRFADRCPRKGNGCEIAQPLLKTNYGLARCCKIQGGKQ